LDRSPELLSWINNWVPTPLVPLQPDEWYNRGHGLLGGSVNRDGLWIPHESYEQWFLWLPPPAAAATALQEFGISRHKRTSHGHLFVCPRLFTNRWRKKLFNIADLVFEVAAGRRSFWPSPLHEPLIVGLILPFVPFPPWQLRGSERLLALERELRQVWQNPLADEWPILRLFAHARECWAPCRQVWCGSCYSTHALDRFPRFIPVDEGGFNWSPVEDTLRHTHAQYGDHLVTPFQCDLCTFHNLQRRNPVPHAMVDEMLLCCIHRVNLDSMWGHESTTVMATLRSMSHMVKMWARVGLTPSFSPFGTLPGGRFVWVFCGYRDGHEIYGTWEICIPPAV